MTALLAIACTVLLFVGPACIGQMVARRQRYPWPPPVVLALPAPAFPWPPPRMS